jgi:hypothetical protein
MNCQECADDSERREKMDGCGEPAPPLGLRDLEAVRITGHGSPEN